MLDHAIRCGLTQGLLSGPVVAIGRNGSTEQLKEVPSKKGRFVLIETPNEVELDISSTQIRKLIAENKSIDHLAPPGVVKYIKENKILMK